MKKFVAITLVIATLLMLGHAITKGASMINLPKLNSLESSRSMISAFGGYDHRIVTSEGYFYNENNLTSDNYPILSTRAEHGIHKVVSGAVDAILVKDKLCYVSDNTVHVGDESVTISGMGKVKQVVSMGAYLVMLNANGRLYYVNTTKLSDSGTCDYTYSSNGYMYDDYEESVNVEFYATDETGKLPYSNKPDKPQKGDLYINEQEHCIKRYSGGDKGGWEVVETHTAIMFPRLQGGRSVVDIFHAGETVFISGISSGGDSFDGLNSENGVVISSVSIQNTIPCITVKYEPTGSLLLDYTSQEVTVTRKSTTLDYICVSNNRLWGCKNGKVGSVFVNEIYASKLGDFKNFDYFPGTNADSYAVSLGSDGAFTGAITFQGSPTFFKEGVMHRVVGTLPSNYQMQTTECQGAKEGSYKSLAIVDNVLYYHANSGIYAYDGSLPQLISFSLGNERYSNAVGGAYLRKYYVNMKSADGVFSTFVYDVDKGIWHKQDEGKQIDMFASSDDALYYICVNTVFTMFGEGEFESSPLKWYAESGIVGTENPDKKYLSRMTLRMSLAFGSTVMIFVEYDSSGEWIPLATIVGNSLTSFSLPIKIERCDHFRIRFDGVGECKIFSITKTMERGGEE